ncbi:hypothetical protein [Bradyrhizobium canariense]|uniref:Uncharacterized protein n=1 Tax=Bradyrhizobium canariense TaxID=255045 RepID=A0A1H1VKF5_9BRAD|nr:hypothetical protein [Bradyrhizobium canariense]SDS85000.1 hypothetical protein SAMN05444158_3442 [Bradyrhizobium canariense]
MQPDGKFLSAGATEFVEVVNETIERGGVTSGVEALQFLDELFGSKHGG